MKSSKNGKKSDTKKKVLTSHLNTLHQRLCHALSLGFRYSDNVKEREWHANDVEVQRLAVRSISAFLDGISPGMLHVAVVKESIPDMVRAMGAILESQNEAVLSLASETAVKLMRVLPSSMVQPLVGHLTRPLSSLLSDNQVQVAVTSAAGLNLIMSNLSVKKEREVWEILDKTGVVVQLISSLRNFSDKVKPIEYFLEMASLLSSIMQLWPPSRYPVWSDVKLMEVLEDLCCKHGTNVKVAVLQLFCALALCGSGAQTLLETAKGLVQTIILCMGKSHHYSVRISAFKLARILMANKERCLKVLTVSCEPVVESITHALSDSSLHHSRVSNHEMMLLMEVCHLALITRWPGKHHAYLWKSRVDKVLHDLLLHNFQNRLSVDRPLSIEELVTMSREGLNSNDLGLQMYVWEIMGWLSAHCEEDFLPEKHSNRLYVNVLVTTACLVFVDSIGKKRLLCQADRAYTNLSISAAKATMLMMYSPCKFITSQATLVLSEVLKLDSDEHLKHLIHALDFAYSGDTFRVPNGFQMLISLIGLTCYSGVPQFSRQVISSGGVKNLLTFIKWWLNNDCHTQRLSLSSHLSNASKERVCCQIDMEDWEGKDIHLLLALWSLAELVNHHTSERLEIDIFAGHSTYSKEELIKDIQDLFISSTSSGLKWFCSYLISFFGFYGFPSKLGKRITTALGDEDNSDIRLVLRNGLSLNVHRVVLLVRCPSFLPPDDPPVKERTPFSGGPAADQVIDKGERIKKDIILSAQVDEDALLKFLDYIYSGYLITGENLVRKLKMLAKHCNIQPLLQLLSKKRPKWEASVPCYDLTPALGSGHDISDIILEAKSQKSEWTCSWCSLPAPHIHAHRVILCSSCEYMRALFQSGMQESRSDSLKVPVSWEALHKLVIWIYSNNLPKPVGGCLWDHMDVDKKISELQPYIELCWLAEFWFLEDVQNVCFSIIISFLDSPELSIKVIQLAADFSQWNLVDVAAKRIAPAYHNLRRSGALDSLEERLVEFVRLASIRLSRV